MASREELLKSLQSGMKLDKNFFLRVYGYDISYPGFSEKVLERLEGLYILYAQQGERHPRELYQATVKEYKDKQLKEGIKAVVAWYAEECRKKWEKRVKEGEEQRKRKEQIMKGLEKMKDGDLLRLWQQRKQKNPEVF